MEWALIIGVALSLIAGYSAGVIREARRNDRLQTSPAPDLRPRCTCNHWFNMHEDGGGGCVVQELEIINGNQGYVDCPCMRYLGPDPAITGMWSKPKES